MGRIDLTYYTAKAISLADIQSVAEQLKFTTFIGGEGFENTLQISTDHGQYLDWELADPDQFNEEDEYVTGDALTTIHWISMGYLSDDVWRDLIRDVFKSHGGWIYDDETPGFSEDTKGQVHRYSLENVDEFLKTSKLQK